MRVPPNYEEMISEIARTAYKYGFCYRKDTLKHEPSLEPDKEDYFNVKIHMQGCGNEYRSLFTEEQIEAMKNQPIAG